MMKLFFVIILSLSSLLMNGQSNPELIPVLDSMVTLDQKWRKLIHQIDKGEVDSLTKEEVWGQILDIDHPQPKL